MAEKGEDKIFLKVPSETIYLELLRKIVAEVAGKVGFPKEGVGKIEMAVDEACTNIIEHSYRAEDKAGYEWRREDEIDRPVCLRVDTDYEKNGLIITITDRGKMGEEFDLESAEVDLDKYLESMGEGSLGIYVIKKFMDEVSYTHKPGVGNELRMAKYFKSENDQELK